MGSSRSEMQCPGFESPMDHQKERTPDRVCVLSLSKKSPKGGFFGKME